MYDLDKLTETSVNFGYVMPNPLQEVFEQIHKAIIEPFQQIIEAVQKVFSQVIEAIHNIFESIRFIFTFQPIYIAEPILQPTEVVSNGYIKMEIDNYGYFKFDGKRLTILNPSSSRCGRILRALLNSKADVVTYEAIKEDMGAGDLNRTFKDLRTQLRRAGYKLVYQRVQRVGIAMLGVIKQR